MQELKQQWQLLGGCILTGNFLSLCAWIEEEPKAYTKQREDDTLEERSWFVESSLQSLVVVYVKLAVIFVSSLALFRLTNIFANSIQENSFQIYPSLGGFHL